MQDKKGFSLIELMTVIAIIAILSAIALPMYTKNRCKAQWGEVPNCLSDVALRLENYRANHGAYPTSSDGSVPAVLNVASTNCGDYYAIQLWATTTDYYIQAADTQKKLPCSVVAGDDEWVLTNSSPKVLHTKNSVSSSHVDPTPSKPS